MLWNDKSQVTDVTQVWTLMGALVRAACTVIIPRGDLQHTVWGWLPYLSGCCRPQVGRICLRRLSVLRYCTYLIDGCTRVLFSGMWYPYEAVLLSVLVRETRINRLYWVVVAFQLGELVCSIRNALAKRFCLSSRRSLILRCSAFHPIVSEGWCLSDRSCACCYDGNRCRKSYIWLKTLYD